jgi:TPR repeat protein
MKGYEKSAEVLLLQAAAHRFDLPTTTALLADIYEMKGDTQTRNQWLRASAKHGFVLSQSKLGAELAHAALSKDTLDKTGLEEGKKWLQFAAEGNCINAVSHMVNIGRALYEKRKQKKAQEWWEIAAKFNHQVAQHNLGVLARDEGNLEEAQSWFVKAAENGHEDAIEAIFAIGCILSKEGKKAEAKQWYKLVAQFKHKKAQFNLGILVRNEGNLQEAKSWFVKAAENGYEAAIECLFEIAGNLYEEQKEEAIKCCKLAAQFNHTGAQFNLGVSARDQEDFEEAQTWFVKAAKNGHEDALEEIIGIGFKYLNKGKKDKAKEAWKLAAKFNHQVAQHNLGVLARDEGNLEEAQTWFVKAAENGHEDALEDIIGIGFEYHNAGKKDKAKKAWELVAQFNNGSTQQNLGVVAREEGNLEEAQSWFLKAADNGGEAAIEGIFEIGFQFYQEKKYTEAKQWWELAAQFNCKKAIYNLGILARAQRELKEAQNWFVKAAEKGDRSAIESLFQIGCGLFKKGENIEANQYYKLAAQFNHEIAQYNLGVFARDEGELEEAQIWFLKAAENGYANACKKIFEVGHDYADRGNLVEAKKSFKLAAQFNHAEAMYILGEIARIEEDLDEAQSWFVKAAENQYSGASESIYRIGSSF